MILKIKPFKLKFTEPDGAVGGATGGTGYSPILNTVIGAVAGLIDGAITNAANKDIAEDNRNFSASEAEKARNWQEEQYRKYSSPSALVRQYEEAGLNPALVAGQGQGVTFTGSSANTPQTFPYQGTGLDALITLIPTLAKLQIDRDVADSQINLNNSAAEKNKQDAAGIEIDNEFKSQHWKKKLDEVDASIDKLRADKGAADAKAALDASSALLNEALADKELFLALKANEEYLKEKWANEFRDKNGYSPDTNIMNALPTFISSVFNDAGISTFGYQEIISAAKRQIQKIKDKMNGDDTEEKK